MIEIRLPEGVWRYDPNKPLGPPGGFGAVFEGLGSNDQPVAVKRLHLAAAEAAHRELRIAGDLAGRDFQHVLPVLDAGQDAESDSYFVVMPVAEGSLSEHLNSEGPLDEAEAVNVLRQIAEGLSEVPDLVHRDLKPANVLRMDGEWKIADFGIARFVEDSTSTRTLRGCLSPPYAAPEQWTLTRATGATDVYALGCIAYALLTGEPPFQGSVEALRELHLNENPPRLEGCSPQLRTLVAMMLRKAPEARPQLGRIRRLLEAVPAEREAPPPDGPLTRIAAARADEEERNARAEAERAAAAQRAADRGALAAEARGILESVFEQMLEQVRGAVPDARIEAAGNSHTVSVGGAALELDLGPEGQVYGPDTFERSNWDVVCGAVVEVRQGDPRHVRQANLWYTRQDRRDGPYRWFEVGYGTNPLTGKGFEFEPCAVTPDLADRAHWVAMDVMVACYPPIPVDDEDAEQFSERWLHIFAEACRGRLQTLPARLPPPYGR